MNHEPRPRFARAYVEARAVIDWTDALIRAIDQARLLAGMTKAELAVRSRMLQRASLERVPAYPPFTMSALAPTPPHRLSDAHGRPYFLWDEDLSLNDFRAKLRDPDPEVRAYFLGKLMRQAKPDDVFSFVTLRELTEQLEAVDRYLGRTRPFWRWLLEHWGVTANGAR